MCFLSNITHTHTQKLTKTKTSEIEYLRNIYHKTLILSSKLKIKTAYSVHIQYVTEYSV